jgi:hypothetical protein
MPPDPCFRSDLSFHPSGESRSSPAPRGALEESGGNESTGNVKKTSRAAGGPNLSARKDRSSSSSHRLPRAVKPAAGHGASTRRVNVVASVSRASPSIYRGTTTSGRIHHAVSLFSPPLSPNLTSEQWRTPANNGFDHRSLHQWEGRLLHAAGYPARPDLRVPGGWRLSAGGVPIPPPPVGSAALEAEIDAVLVTLSDK